MPERALLSALAAYLSGAGLSPTPAMVGPAEPEDAGDLPCLVLSLERSERAGAGVGERSERVTGALAWTARVDLANPVLPEDPTFRLLNTTRTLLVLPHGGLVRNDGTEGLLRNDVDIRVRLDGTPRAFKHRPDLYGVRFTTPVPATGIVEVDYFVGQWERRTARIAGVLRVDACAADAAQAAALSDTALDALAAPAARAQVRRLVSLAAAGVGSIAGPEPGTTLRRRSLRFAFVFEHEQDRPESSGGVIRSIPVTANVGG
ncbi:MAG TPA: hypothetical protein VFQ45_16520 [Longimicrobium sp.]|nr:hypothetical protein [Longimicrobium sp.]